MIGAKRSDLESAKGIGSEAALFLKLLDDLSLNYLSRSRSDVPIRSLDGIESYFCRYFADSDANLCCILCSGAADTPVSIPTDELLSGAVSRRRLTEILLANHTSRIAVGINHPHSYPLPSDEDYAVTRLFAQLAQQLSIEFTDSVIQGSGKCFSMRKNGAFSFEGGSGNG